jgi:hypothetical protein
LIIYRYFGYDTSAPSKTAFYKQRKKLLPNGQSKTGFNQIHINSFYSILDKRFTDILVQPCCKTNEYAAFCSMVDAAKSIISIFLGDRGYASYKTSVITSYRQIQTFRQ